MTRSSVEPADGGAPLAPSPSAAAARHASTPPPPIPSTGVAVERRAFPTCLGLSVGSSERRRPAIPATAGGENDEPHPSAGPPPPGAAAGAPPRAPNAPP